MCIIIFEYGIHIVCKLSTHINIQRVIRYRSYHSAGTVVTAELSKKYP